jgi:predicted acylesterase/phospholipase RssA
MLARPLSNVTLPSPSSRCSKVAVALSGGGHRATLFGLGALLYLVDSGVAKHVVSIASVSGGSIVNGLVAQEVDFRNTSPEAFRKMVAVPLATRIATRGVLFAAPLTWVFILVAVIVGVATIVLGGLWPLPINVRVRASAFVVVATLLASLLKWRGHLHDYALGKYLFHRHGKRTKLATTSKAVDHIFCATDLEGQHHVYFAQRFVWSHDHGIGTPGDVDLATVIQASSAFPGGFPPRILKKAQFRFVGGKKEVATNRLVLSDGGVYDNMGEQWAVGYRRRGRIERTGVLSDRAADCMVIVNASSGPTWLPFRTRMLPFANEFTALMRVIHVMFGQTTAARRKRLRAQFADDKDTMSGVFVKIDRSLAHVAKKALRRRVGSEACTRARAVLALPDVERLETEAVANRTVPTSLSCFDKRVVARLVRHGYVSTMCNGHVLFEWPLLPLPSFDELTSTTPRRNS